MVVINSSCLISSLCLSQNHSKNFMKWVVTTPLDHWPSGQALPWGNPIVAREISSICGDKRFCLQNDLNSAVNNSNFDSTDCPGQNCSLSSAATKEFATQCFPHPKCTLCQKSHEKQWAVFVGSTSAPLNTEGRRVHGATVSTVFNQPGETEKSS